jgi:transposase
MIKLLVYGYSYGIRSSRKLERACYDNLLFIWLIEGLKPDFKTIADFRKNNKNVIKQILKQTVKLCFSLNLIDGDHIFIDGTKIRANTGIKNTYNNEKCLRHIEKLDKKLDKKIDEIKKMKIHW